MTRPTLRAELDPFSRRQADDVTKRWAEAKRDHQTTAAQLWLGMVLDRFTGHELEILERAGAFSDNDRRLLRAARQVAS